MNDENPTPDLHLYMDAILRRFRLALEEDATHFFTTAEVCDAIRVLNPEIKGLALAVVHDALVEAGFRLGSPLGMQSLAFRWMMEEK
ncbi:hypothetical protein [Porphyromonas gulae]|uniref:hypothetical protein n=1 Tax=Porphyromonas gulae TaxID=111105 RepID=UPI00052BABAF|nr:hypothetical protein [Porphyromonas gulae]KGN87668.1 hypothetical protein HQ46_08610 [Porphyromonas gulae]